jgi:hypothetical protein
VATASFAILLRAYRVRGPDRTPCERCPERTRAVCSGFAPIVRRERAVQRVARAWLTETSGHE